MVSSWSVTCLTILSMVVPAMHWATSSARPSLAKARTIVSVDHGDVGRSGEETWYSTSASTLISTLSRTSSAPRTSLDTSFMPCKGGTGNSSEVHAGEWWGDLQEALQEISDMMKWQE